MSLVFVEHHWLPVFRNRTGIESSQASVDSTGGTPVRPRIGQGASSAFRRRGIALLDLPNIRSAYFHILGRHPKRNEYVDWRGIRHYLSDRFGIRRFRCVNRRRPFRSDRPIRTAIERAGWQYIAVERSKHGWDETDPVDDRLHHEIRRLTEESETRSPSVCLLSHDGGFASSLKRVQEREGSVAVIGFVERMSKKLYQLTDAPESEVVDLEFDVQALPVRLSQRDSFSDRKVHQNANV